MLKFKDSLRLAVVSGQLRELREKRWRATALKTLARSRGPLDNAKRLGVRLPSALWVAGWWQWQRKAKS